MTIAAREDNKVNDKKNKPLLKWVGGKTQLLNHILPKTPKRYKKYSSIISLSKEWSIF